MGKRGPKPRRKEIIWSPNFAYGVGLLATDGCLWKDGLHFTFVSKDKEQIENIKKCLDINTNPFQKTSGRPRDFKLYYRLQWGDVTLHNYLNSVGITSNKSLTIGVIDIPDAYFFDFLRGSYDGDGCFYSYFDPRWKNSFMFYLSFTSASLAHIKWLQSELNRLIQVKGHISSKAATNNRNGFHQLRFGKREAYKILTKMYATDAGICLSRKRLKIVKALGIVGLSLPSQA